MEIERDTFVGGRGRGRMPIPDSDLRRPHISAGPGAIQGVSEIHDSGGVFSPTHSQFPDHLSNSMATMAINSSNIRSSSVSSTLSADAPVFVPRSPQFVPSEMVSAAYGNINGVPVAEEQHIPHITGPQLKYINNPVILQINNLVVNLTMKPQRFEQIATQMTSVLSWKVKDAELMKEVIFVIFEQGIGEANFRFNGGRLCHHLHKHITQSYEGPSFKTLLLQKCQDEFGCREYYLHTDSERLCGFTLFLADIFRHLVTQSRQPIGKLKEGLCQLMMTLMSNPTQENMKCVAQVLKGSGSLLDSCDRDEMESVMCRLKDVTMSPQLPINSRSMLVSVIELRASNWGKAPDGPAGEQQQQQQQPEPDEPPHLGTVYYGPGGVVQRVEDEVDDSASDTDDAFYCPSLQTDELEGEVAEAFEEFLKGQAPPDMP